MDKWDREKLADGLLSLLSCCMPVLIQINDRMLNKAVLLSEQFIGGKMQGRHEMPSVMEDQDRLNVFLTNQRITGSLKDHRTSIDKLCYY